MWSENLDELILNISEHFGDFFRDKTVEKGKQEEGDLTKEDWERADLSRVQIQQEHSIVTPIQNKPFLQKQEELQGVIKGGVSIEQLESRLKHRPLYQRYWLECTGQVGVGGDNPHKGPRGLLVDLYQDSFLPQKHRKVYMVKNNLRWNVQGYKDKKLSLGSFNEFTKLLFNKTTLKRNFNYNGKYPRYIWEQIQKEWNFAEKPGFKLIPHVKRPQIFMLKDDYTEIKSSNKNTISDVLKLQTIEEIIGKINYQMQSGVRLDSQAHKILKKFGVEDKYPNLVLVCAKDGKPFLELLEPRLYSQLKENLTLRNNSLVFQRFWYECTDRIEVAGRASKKTPRGLIVDLTRDSFLPKRHRKVYLVKNSKYWNILGYKDSSLSAGSFDNFIKFLFIKKTIKNFNQNVQYPRYIWEQIQSIWNLAERPGFKLRLHGYRPSIYELKKEYTRNIVEKAMVGVYNEFIFSSNRNKRQELNRSGFRNLAEFMDQTKENFKVLKPSQYLERKLDSLMRDLLK